jgi:uncharacterized protein with FMN-binding domain
MKKKRILIIATIVILGIIIILVGIKAHLESNFEQLANLKISDMDLMKLDDGTYTGSYEVFPVAVEVSLDIKNHKITEIKLLKHTNGQGTPAEVILEKVIEAQSLDVDIVSGATYSSKVILKAIENAMNNAQ